MRIWSGSRAIGKRLDGAKVTQMNDNVGTNTQHLAVLDESAWTKRHDAEVAEAQLLLTPADEHLNERRIVLGKLADEAEDAARRLRDGGLSEDE